MEQRKQKIALTIEVPPRDAILISKLLAIMHDTNFRDEGTEAEKTIKEIKKLVDKYELLEDRIESRIERK